MNDKPHILVIEDEDTVRLFIRIALESAQYRVSEARDGNEAVAAYKKEPVDIVITDILLPEKDGIETIISLRQINPGIKIVAISGAARRETLLSLAGIFNADRCLKKPFTKDELIATVKEVLDQKDSSYKYY